MINYICDRVAQTLDVACWVLLRIVISAIVTSEIGQMRSSLKDASTCFDPRDVTRRSRAIAPDLVSPSYDLARSALPRERFRCVPGMFSSSEVKVLHPT
jgi:hypothetical protein